MTIDVEAVHDTATIEFTDDELIALGEFFEPEGFADEAPDGCPAALKSAWDKIKVPYAQAVYWKAEIADDEGNPNDNGYPEKSYREDFHADG